MRPILLLVLGFALTVGCARAGQGYGSEDALRDLASDDAATRAKGAGYYWGHPEEYTTEVRDALLKALDKPGSRTMVINALGAAKEGRAVPYLLKMIDGPSGHDCALALGRIGDKAAVPYLLAMAEVRGPDSNVLLALGKLRDERAVVPLLEMLRTHPSNRDIANALGHIGDRRAVEPLLHLAESYLNTGRGQPCIRAIGRLADRRAMAVLTAFSKHGNAAFRSDAAEALGRLRSHEAVRRLQEMLATEEDADVIDSVIVGLGICANEDAVRLLADQLQSISEDEVVPVKQGRKPAVDYKRKNAIVRSLAATQRASALVAVAARLQAWEEMGVGRFLSLQGAPYGSYIMIDLMAMAGLTGS